MVTALSANALLGGGNPSFFIVIIIMFVAMYFFSIRPQKKREKEEAAMRSSVDIGDKIITIGGISGVVISAKDDEDNVVIETGGDKTRLRIKRWSIQTRIPLVVPTDDLDDDDFEDDDFDDEPIVEEPKKRSLFGWNKKDSE